MHTKRLIAYIIDLIFITSFLMILFYFLPVSNETKKIQTKIDEIGEEYALGTMGKMDYFMQLSNLEKKLSEKEAIQNIINSIVIVIYYIFIPYFMSGSTFGKRMMNLKIVGKDGKKVNLLSLFIRSFLVDGLLACLLITVGVYFIPETFYLSFVSILVILQVLTLIISFFMIKYRGNLEGLEDICSQSKVIKINEGSEL
jgi:uncharacterized RDD family membrane protein YckC